MALIFMTMRLDAYSLFLLTRVIMTSSIKAEKKEQLVPRGSLRTNLLLKAVYSVQLAVFALESYYEVTLKLLFTEGVKKPHTTSRKESQKRLVFVAAWYVQAKRWRSALECKGR